MARVSWYWDWATTPLPDTDADFAMMQWESGNLELLASSPALGTAIALFGFNEPTQIIDENPAGCISTSAIEWWDGFFTACAGLKSQDNPAGCIVDFMTLHTYFCNLEPLSQFLSEVYTRYRKPIWVTEFACPGGDAAQQLAFMQAATSLMDSLDYVTKYSWFAPRVTNTYVTPPASLLEPLSESGGAAQLTSLGQAYFSVHSSELNAFSSIEGPEAAVLSPAEAPVPDHLS